MAREVVLRQLSCRWPGCGLVFYICNSCYRGHRYCGDRCRKKEREQRRGPTSDTSKAGRDGSITATGNGPGTLPRRIILPPARADRSKAIEGNGKEHAVGGGIARSDPV